MRISGRLVLLGVTLSLLVASAAQWMPSSEAGGVINVNTTEDEVNGDGDCSLREAVQSLSGVGEDACAGGNSINVPAGTYTLTMGQIEIFYDGSITGAGAGSTIVDGDANDRVFNISSKGGPITVTMTGLTVQNGLRKGDAGGINIENDSTLTLNSVVVTNNEAASDGGGIQNQDGTLNLNQSTVSNNTAGDEGGGIYNEGPDTLNVNNSTITGNIAEDGGGIMNEFDAAAVITNSTISNNTASNDGGGITNDQCCGVEATIITNSTISGNTAGSEGGGISNTDEGALQLTNVTISDNSATEGGGISNNHTVSFANSIVVANTPDNCFIEGGKGGGTNSSLGHNMEDADDCALGGPGDQTNTDPTLGALGANGGPTQTHALLAGSPAIDTADDALCPATDQRGVSRPQDGDEDGTAICDIGAYEAEGAAEPPPPPAGEDAIAGEVSNPNPQPGETVELTVTVTDDAGNPRPGVACTFTIITQPGSDASLGATEATTDENGQATVPLNVGSTPGLVEVQADCEGLTEVLAVNVGGEVLAPETGSAPIDGSPAGALALAVLLATIGGTSLYWARRRGI